MEKSLLGRKENQNKKRMSWAYGQRHVAGGIPAGLGHIVRLVTIPLHGFSSPLQDEAGSLLRTAKTRIAWRSLAEEWQMVFLAPG